MSSNVYQFKGARGPRKGGIPLCDTCEAKPSKRLWSEPPEIVRHQCEECFDGREHGLRVLRETLVAAASAVQIAHNRVLEAEEIRKLRPDVDTAEFALAKNLLVRLAFELGRLVPR